MKNLAAAYWGHDSAICFYNARTKTFHTIEIEKLTGIKHYRGHGRKTETRSILRRCLKIAEDDFGIKNDFDTFIIGSSSDSLDPSSYEVNSGLSVNPHAVRSVFNVRELKVSYRHHAGHAWCGYAQSPWAGDECVIFTHDAGGDDGHTFIWKTDGSKMISVQKPRWQRDGDCTHFGRTYNLASCNGVNDIVRNTPIVLDIAGKVMGAAAYGSPLSPFRIVGERLYKEDPDTVEWMNPLLKVFKRHYLKEQKDLESEGRRGYRNGKEWINEIFCDTPEMFNPYESWISPVGPTWQEQCDIALGIQMQHEKQVLDFLKKHLKTIRKYKNRLVISGGCGLNVLANSRIQKELGVEVFVPPNVIDSGLPFGFLVQHLAENSIDTWKKANITYSGPKIKDYSDLEWYKKNYYCKKIDLEEFAQLLKEDQIIALVQGRSEVGPRALGNRSILCDPKGTDKKDLVNIVKKRESYRPFAPVCRREDAEKYFEADSYDNLAFMNFAVKTREAYKEELAAVTHVDGTARLQTVTKKQNKLLYDLLTKFNGVLLNTSFNVRGKPILNSLEEAFEVLDSTELDALVIEFNNELWFFNSSKR